MNFNASKCMKNKGANSKNQSNKTDWHETFIKVFFHDTNRKLHKKPCRTRIITVDDECQN